MAKCRECGRPIVFIKTKAGKMMPCDPGAVLYWEAPGVSGKVITLAGDVVSCYLGGDESKSSGVGYVPHWGSCPGAETIRRRTKERRDTV